MPARTALFLALLILPLAASAQPALIDSRGPVETAPAPLTPYVGTFAAPGGSIELVDAQGTLTILATGAPVAAALAGLSPSDSRLDARAATLLSAWVDGDLAPLAASVRTERQPIAAAHFATTRSALTRRLGDVRGVEILGTFRQTDGHRSTLVRISFERGAQWMSLVWTNTNELATLKRGLNPVLAGYAQPIERDRFVSAGTPVTFDRDTTGRIQAVTIGRQLKATR